MSLPPWILHSTTGQRDRAAIRCMTSRAKGFHVFILPHKESPPLNTTPEHPAKSNQQSQCWNANEPPDGSNAFMNNAALCAVHLRFPVLITEQSWLWLKDRFVRHKASHPPFISLVILCEVCFLVVFGTPPKYLCSYTLNIKLPLNFILIMW